MTRKQGGANMSAGKIVLLVFGIIFMVGAIPVLVLGGTLVWADSEYVDSDGYVTSDDFEMETTSYAIVGGPIEIDKDAEDALRWIDVGPFRVKATNNDPSKGTFRGIAEETDVEAYLADVDYAEIAEIDEWPIEDPDYDYHLGDSVPAAPASLDIWAASVSGTGTQTLEWEFEEGDYMVVVMNEDGSEDVAAEAELAAKVPRVVLWTGIILLVLGIVALAGGVLMTILSLRGRKSTGEVAA
jgi:hypothetical protein